MTLILPPLCFLYHYSEYIQSTLYTIINSDYYSNLLHVHEVYFKNDHCNTFKLSCFNVCPIANARDEFKSTSLKRFSIKFTVHV